MEEAFIFITIFQDSTGDNSSGLAGSANLYLDCNNQSTSTDKNGIIWKTKYNTYSKTSAGIYFQPQANYFRGGLAFYTNDTGNYTNNHEERMRIDMCGNVGIGTNYPGTKLHIKGEGAMFRLSGTELLLYGILS